MASGYIRQVRNHWFVSLGGNIFESVVIERTITTNNMISMKVYFFVPLLGIPSPYWEYLVLIVNT